MSKKPKKKKRKLSPAFWICVIAIVLIIVLLNIKNKRQNQANNANGFTGPAFENSDTTAVGYVKDHYLKFALIEDIMGGATKENKMKYVIDLLNNEAGTRQKEISEEAVKAKYKDVFAEDLELEDKIIMTPNEYKHETVGGNFILDTNQEIDENPSTPAQEEKNQEENLEPRDTTHKLLITGATTNGDSTTVNIKVANIKTAYEILTIAQAHPDQYDVAKIEEIANKEQMESEDMDYLYDLITDENMDDLMITNYTSKMTVKKNGSDYIITKYEIDN